MTRLIMARQGWTAPRARCAARAYCLSPQRGLLVGAGEIGEQAITALDRGVEPLLRGLLPGPDRLELLVHDVADLHEIADAQTLRVVGRRFEVELLHRRVAPGELVVEALRARERV